MKVNSKRIKKHWWNNNLQELKNEINEKYKIYKWSRNNQQVKEHLKNLRKEFRKEQRRAKYKSENQKYMKLSKLRKTNMKQFWKNINREKKSKIKIKIPIENIKTEYKTLFTDEIIYGEKELKIKQEVKEYWEKYKNKIEIYKIDKKIMTKILKQLPNNISMGHSGVINEMVKYSRGNKMENIITDLIQTIICTGINPNRMNIGRVIPIIKNNQLSNEMLSNIRPITISDTMSNILEKYLLEKINIDSKDNKHSKKLYHIT